MTTPKTNRLRAATLALAALAASALASTASAQVTSPPQRSLVPVAGDLYRFQNNFHTAAVYVTSAGIVVVDPINADGSK